MATHRQTIEGKKSPTYNSWDCMIQRCTNPKNDRYLDYGGAGVVVCDAWLRSFTAFLEDMGERPVGTSIDRYPNPSGNYEPGNCRWANRIEQAQTRRARRKIVHSVRHRWARKEHCGNSTHPAMKGQNLYIAPRGDRQCRACICEWKRQSRLRKGRN
jgi:hypothetical protein